MGVRRPTRGASDLPVCSDISEAEEEGSSADSALTPCMLQQNLWGNEAQRAAVPASVTYGLFVHNVL
jgi:hypothetical protein